MRDFDSKFPGLDPEQIRIKQKIWERERERERQLFEALKRKNPFARDDGDEDTGGWEDVVASDIVIGHGTISDAAISGARVSFVYPDGSLDIVTSDLNGTFSIPQNFTDGTIIASGGTDTVTGLPFTGELRIDGKFFNKYKTITPLTHIANHIWVNTDTQTPEEALDLVINNLSGFVGIPVDSIDKDKVFNDDHVKLTLEGVSGAKEVQAINTLIEIHTELLSNTECTKHNEVEERKIRAYEEMANALLLSVKGESEKCYSDDILHFHDLTVNQKYQDCLSNLLSKASVLIQDSLQKDIQLATSEIQAINLAVKSEWAKKAFEMTSNSRATVNSVWNSIENKTPELLVNSVSVPTI